MKKYQSINQSIYDFILIPLRPIFLSKPRFVKVATIIYIKLQSLFALFVCLFVCPILIGMGGRGGGNNGNVFKLSFEILN